MSVTAHDMALPAFNVGSFTSAGTAADVKETVGYRPSMVICIIDSGGTNPNIVIKHDGETDESILITGSTGVITSPADSAGITMAADGFTVESGAQVNSGTNQWIAFR